jgi:hypothetical protein
MKNPAQVADKYNTASISALQGGSTVRVRGERSLPHMQPVGRAGGLVTHRCAVRGGKVKNQPKQLPGRSLRGANTAYMRRSSSADLPKRALIKGGLRALSSAASSLKSSLAACLAPHLEQLKTQDACYQQALERGADQETLAQLEQEMRSTAGTIRGITDELTKMYDRLVDTIYLIYSGLTGGEFADVLAARLSKLDPGLVEIHRTPDFSSTGLGLDHLSFRYEDVKGRLDHAFEILSVYEALADDRCTGFGQPPRSIGLQWASGAGQFGEARTPWIVNTLA